MRGKGARIRCDFRGFWFTMVSVREMEPGQRLKMLDGSHRQQKKKKERTRIEVELLLPGRSAAQLCAYARARFRLGRPGRSFCFLFLLNSSLVSFV
jgi:hypothetical protein